MPDRTLRLTAYGGMPRAPLRFGLSALSAVLLTVAVTSGAAAQSPPPEPPGTLDPDVSAADAYRESVPTSVGPRAVSPDKARLTTLPAHIRRELRREGPIVAAQLKTIAISPTYGAPQVAPRQARGDNGTTGPPKRATHRPARVEEPRRISVGTALRRTIDASGVRLAAFGLLLVAVTALIVAAAMRPRRTLG